jgi:hypothetical protein
LLTDTEARKSMIKALADLVSGKDWFKDSTFFALPSHDKRSKVLFSVLFYKSIIPFTRALFP